MPIYGFESQDDFNRARDVIRTVEGQRVDLTRTKRGRYPSATGGGSGLKPYIITVEDGADSVAYTKYGVNAFDAKPYQDALDVFPTENDITVDGFYLGGAVFSGCRVMVQRGKDNYAISGDMGDTFFAAATADIAAGDDGDVEIEYRDAFDAIRTVTVNAHNYTERGITSGTQVVVSLVSWQWSILEVLC